ncbi:MAG: zinc-dependent alcohol dehydrogenase family protein [Desulfobacterales bacterium]|jgi:propanol-preferring alcohol dehydrogenase
MKAMLLNHLCKIRENPKPLKLVDLPEPVPDDNQVLIKVSRCGVCHTELDEIEGRLPPPHLPVVLGHQVVGQVVHTGSGVRRFRHGDRVGIAWIHSACGQCRHCQSGQENLCYQFMATGRDRNGGYAEFMTVAEDFAHEIPGVFSDSQAAPLLCAGAIGYRSMRLTGLRDGLNLGLTGFGASAHLVLKMVRHSYPNTAVFVFARNKKEREFARELGACWAGDTGTRSPENLDCVIDTTPAWKPVVEALNNLKPGGRLVINAIRKEEMDKSYLLNLNYASHLWLEKEIKSVANVTRNDVGEFLQLAAEIPLRPEVQEFALEDANRALLELKKRDIRGAKVLRID